MPDERQQHPYDSGPQRGYPPPPQGSHPPHPYGPSGAPGYYGPPPAVHVHLPPKKRAVWPWIVLLCVVILPFAGCAGLFLLGVGITASRDSADDTAVSARRDSPPQVTPRIPSPGNEPSTFPTAAPPSLPPFAPPLAPTTTAMSGPRQITYEVTGAWMPGDVVTVTYTDASGSERTQRKVYLPWSLTITPKAPDSVVSVRASSAFSNLNCSIRSSDGMLLSSNSANAAQVNC